MYADQLKASPSFSWGDDTVVVEKVAGGGVKGDDEIVTRNCLRIFCNFYINLIDHTPHPRHPNDRFLYPNQVSKIGLHIMRVCLRVPNEINFSDGCSSSEELFFLSFIF